MKELLRKTYKIEIEMFDGRQVIFAFKQATLRELLEMSESINSESDMKNWLVDFLMKKATASDKINKKDFELLMPKRVTEIIEWMTETYAKGFFTKSDGKQKKQSRVPTSSMIVFILEHTNETLETLLELTWEQIDYLLKGAIWNENEKTEKGRKRNEREAAIGEARGAWSDEEAKELVRKLEERMAKGNIKFQPAKKRKIG